MGYNTTVFRVERQWDWIDGNYTFIPIVETISEAPKTSAVSPDPVTYGTWIEAFNKCREDAMKLLNRNGFQKEVALIPIPSWAKERDTTPKEVRGLCWAVRSINSYDREEE